ncbi:histidine phosphatase family protein [Rheinheimera riviphila]|uniref:Histidine phosphatase family protein n=1 Tax=Rheinheimera riviphila TaxID=1834037 RepID=A0A437R1H2_9GAMM|nr:histidine phosphatase family protein [Rheinheimera riviphila]RVU40581.1 histidine phosphatase family protein [Rheinheimera riviphila]
MTSSFKQLLQTGCITSLLFCSSAMATSYQLFLVRHAEKAATKPDPELSACGQQQAAALAALLKDVALPQLFHTPYQRTMMTAKALSQQDRKLQPYDPAQLAQFAAQLQQNQQSAVVVGHSNTTPALAALLSGQQIAAMAETEYGIIYQLVFSDKQLITLNRLQLPPVAACVTATP